tara:strand:+ start:2138 stop:7012 length:4875 start_codon:yes stop_codon:yes gene_type:complete
MKKNILHENDINLIIERIKLEPFGFINEEIKINIIKSIKSTFPLLKESDKNLLFIVTSRVIDIISLKFGFDKLDTAHMQWLNNNNMDIISIILILLPFLDDIKDNGKVFSSLTSLSQILVNNDTNIIKSDILNKSRVEVIKKELYYSNFSINLTALNEDNLFNYDYANKRFYANASDKNIKMMLINKFFTLIESIKLITGKLYVNWINIVPLIKNNYKNEMMYKNTIIKYNKVQEEFKNNITNILRYQELYLNNEISLLKERGCFEYSNNISLMNYPNTLSNFCYESLKNIKWMIYCRNFDKDNGIYYIQILDKLLNLGDMMKYSYYDLPIKNKTRFDKQYSNLLKKLSNNDIIINDISRELQYTVLKTLIIFLVSNKKFNYTKNLKKFVVEESKISKTNFEIEFKKSNYNPKTDKELYEAFRDLNKHLFWDYLRNSLLKLKYNYLGNFLFCKNKEDDYIINQNFYYYLESKLTLKNIYNFGKFLTFKSYNPPEKFNYDVFMKREDINIIFIKLFNFNDTEFISNNLQIQFGKKPPSNWFKTISKNLKENIHNLVWEILIHNGLLSKFTFNHDIMKASFLSKNQPYKDKIITKKLKENIIPKYKSGHYFFTNTSYEDLPKIIDGNKPTTYLEQLTNIKNLKFTNPFYTYYSFNWLFQINFFSHFFFNNINYITGSTGQGKSTQLPKLYAYSFKAFKFIPNPKIISTQPRLDPTENIAWVAQEVGLPINYSKNDKKISTNNFYLQFKHSKNNHIKEDCYHPVIRSVTDGTIYNMLTKNIFLYRQYYNNDNKKMVNIPNTTEFDAILIDESHEHNKNMDLILSDIKLTLEKNNKIKLGIISATLDDDEPIYRSFYLTVPPPFENGYWIDPRMHISPPGKTTKFKIIEHYEIDENKEENITRSVKKVRHILKNSINGQILVFSTGQGDIIKLVELINKQTSSDVIALPYFSAMNSSYKDIILDIDKKISNLKNKKDRVHLEWGEKFIQDKKVPNNMYSRAVIVATNVAEASITIPGLKFVVDNGYQKVNKYNMKQKTKVFSIEKISEASRKQRKGRVGRKESGDVYYLYPKGAREEIMPKYKITEEDISDILMSVLSEQKNTNESIKLLSDKEEEILMNRVKVKLRDYNGIYYIINPFEDKIKRNILHNIIEFNDKKQAYIDEEYFDGFYNNLARQLLVIFKKDDDVILTIKDGFNPETTEFFDAVSTLTSKLLLERKYIIILIMSRLIGIFKESMLLIPVIQLLETGVSYLATNRGKDFKHVQKKFGRYSSDIFSLFTIVDNFKKFFNKLLLFTLFDETIDNLINPNITNINNISRKYNEIFEKQEKKYRKYINSNKNTFEDNNIIDEETYQVFKKLNNQHLNYVEKLRFKEWFKKNDSLDSVFMDEFKKNNDIKFWCNNNNIDYNFILFYYKKLIQLFKKIYTLDTEIDKYSNEKNYFELYGHPNIVRQSSNKVSNLNLLEKLELVFLYGNVENIFYRETDTENYISFYSQTMKGVINNFYGSKLSFNKEPSEFICCVNKFERNDELMLNIIINLKPEYLGKYLATIFNKKNFKPQIKRLDRDNNTNLTKYSVNKLSKSNLHNFYFKIYNNTSIENHLLYNKYLDDDNIDKYNTLYENLKKLKLK